VSLTGPKSPRPEELDQLEAMLGHRFERAPLLIQALTHSSLAYERANAEHPGAPPSKIAPEDADNEQLEFLGDAVVGLLVAESLCKRHPELQEGQLTRLRAALVSRRHLGEVGARLHIGDYLRLGRGEERSGGRRKNAILANSIEAIIAALYLDAGLDTVRGFVEREIVDPSLAGLLEQMERGSNIGDHKSALQELLQARRLGPPQYSVKSESGPDHSKRFVVEVRLSGGEPGMRPLAAGDGVTKKRAEQEAARRAFNRLRSDAQPFDSEVVVSSGASANQEPPASDAGSQS